MKRKTFHAEFKAKIEVEVLRGKKEIYTIAVGNESAPDQRLEWGMVSMIQNFL